MIVIEMGIFKGVGQGCMISCRYMNEIITYWEFRDRWVMW